MGKSHLEAQFLNTLSFLDSELYGMVECELKIDKPRAYRKSDRKSSWRIDFAFSYKAARLAVEIEGGTWANGRHSRGSGFIADCDKYNYLTETGWRVLRYTSNHLSDNPAAVINQIRITLGLSPLESNTP
jgi:very-short-patch-repair endonuclease